MFADKLDEVNLAERLEQVHPSQNYFTCTEVERAVICNALRRVRPECGRSMEDADMWRIHARAFDDFLNELYAIMVNPCATGTIKRDDLMKQLKAAAILHRDLDAGIAARSAKQERK